VNLHVQAGHNGLGGIHQEITGALGSNVGLVDLRVLFEANLRCNELGMDPDSLGFTLSMAMECAQEKVYTADQVELDLRFGDGAERFALNVKGLEMVPFEPRTQTNLALGYAVAPIGPRYDICEHDWDFDTRVGWAHTLDHSRTLGILDRIPMEQLSAEKVRNYKALATIRSGADALDFCIFAIAPTRVFSLQEMADMLAAVTGWDTSAYEIMRWGERRLHLMRLYNLGAGLTAADDTLPARFFDEPIHEGDWAGTRLDRAKFEEAVRTYYVMMEWDLGGRPRRETLIDHHLEWAA
jgi:aldehyde:ferredoxin oxidoreductase